MITTMLTAHGQNKKYIPIVELKDLLWRYEGHPTYTGELSQMEDILINWS